MWRWFLGLMYRVAQKSRKTLNTLACSYFRCGGAVVTKGTVSTLLSDYSVARMILSLHGSYKNKENNSVCCISGNVLEQFDM